jgi:hypothetical protein
MPRLLSLTTVASVAATAISSTSAFAEAPGETPVVPAPVVDQPCAARRVPIMQHRFSVSLGLGGMGVSPESNPEASTDFGIGQLALRYRATRHLELEVAFAGGGQTVNGEEGELAIGMASLGVRYRFAPERRWNWFVGAGIGAANIAAKDATEEEIDEAGRPTAHLGIGVERRFRRLAVQAELRFVGMGPTFAERIREEQMPSAPASTIDPAPPSMTSPAAVGLGGGMFTIGASYYF